MALHQPGSMSDPPPPGAPGMPRPGTEPGGPSVGWAGATIIPGPARAGLTPGDSVRFVQLDPPLPIPAQGGQGRAPHANSSARLSAGGGTYPS